jgi:putative restriction endonuclease
MAINLVVAVTDYDWFQTLRVREDWPEVNFWAPSGASFRALQPGELFLFKLHSPRNYIVGGNQSSEVRHAQRNCAADCGRAWLAAWGEIHESPRRKDVPRSSVSSTLIGKNTTSPAI